VRQEFFIPATPPGCVKIEWELVARAVGHTSAVLRRVGSYPPAVYARRSCALDSH